MAEIEKNATESQGTTWAEWGHSLTSAIPSGVPLVPGHAELQKDWPSYGRAWGMYHTSTSGSTGPAPPPALAPVAGTAPLSVPQPPTTEASELDWATYGRFIGAYHATLDQSRPQSETEAAGQAWREYGTAVGEVAKKRGENNRRWSGYGRSWSEYGKAVGETAKKRGGKSSGWSERGKMWSEYGTAIAEKYARGPPPRGTAPNA